MLLCKKKLRVLFLIGHVALAAAQCLRGYERRNGVCVACAAGKYKDDMGPGPCRECWAETFSTVVGATSESVCRECNSTAGLTTIEAGQTSCICKAGWISPTGGAPCTKCPDGTVTNAFGAQECVSCPEGLHAGRQGYMCEECPDGAMQPPGGAFWYTCVCKPGFFGERWSDGNLYCDYCQPGYYQDQMGAPSCKQCPTGTSSYYQAETCTGCTENSFFRPTRSACYCNAGYGGARNSPCVACAPGKYIWETGVDKQDGCLYCEDCQECPAGKYQDQSGASACVQCAEDMYSNTAGATACLSCNANLALNSLPQTSNAARDACVCRPGNTRADGVCVECAANTFKTDAGDEACTGCGYHSLSPTGSSSGDACVCDVGYGVYF
jgi:hypothetical protein